MILRVLSSKLLTKRLHYGVEIYSETKIPYPKLQFTDKLSLLYYIEYNAPDRLNEGDVREM